MTVEQLRASRREKAEDVEEEDEVLSEEEREETAKTVAEHMLRTLKYSRYE